MIIICEKCSTKFNVPDSAIGASGRQVKCSSCTHSWLVKPEAPIELTVIAQEPETLATAPEIKVESVTIPVKSIAETPTATGEIKATHKRYVPPSTPIYQKSFIYYGSFVAAGIALVCFLAFAIVFHRIPLTNKIPALQSAFDLAGLYNNEGLKLEIVDCTISEVQSSKSDDNTIEIEVDVSVLNTSEQDRKLGDIRFTVYDIERNYVGELFMTLDLVIAPNKNTKVEGRLNRVPKDSFYVAIDLGNRLDLKILNPDIMHKIG
jgi:predicted Zn finger-like uncharacterized protein